MKCQILVAIILRLLAMYWMTLFVTGLLSSVGLLLQTSSMYMVQTMLHPIFYGTLSFLVWVFAEPISHRVVGHTNPELSLKEVTAEHLYTCGILGFGIYQATSHLPQLINIIHYTVVNKAGDQWMRDENTFSMYDVTRELFACLIGLALVALSPMIARKINAASERLHQRKKLE
jgi:hypothetical protein